MLPQPKKLVKRKNVHEEIWRVINLAKLELVPIGNANNVEGSARIMGFRVSS
jgi:hypothetical protein